MNTRVKFATQWLVAGGLAVAAGMAIESLVIRSGGASFLSNDSGHAVVQLDRTRHDFGTVRQGPTLETTFLLRNSGKQRLIVRKLNGSCDCLSGPVAEIVLPPGETEPLPVRLDTSMASGAAEMELTYRTSDPACPTFTLVVSADIKRP